MSNIKNENSGERLIDRLDAYARFKNLSDSIITREAGLAVGTLGKSRKAGKDLSRRTAELVLNVYTDLNRQWFLNGDGEMLVSMRAPSFPVYPLIDTSSAECGQPGGLAEAALAESLPVVGIPGIPAETDFFIQSRGYSMINKTNPELSIPPGSLVGVSKLDDNTFLRWGEVYMLSTYDGVVIKRLLQDENPKYVRCASYNKEEYPEFRLGKDEILEIGRITCVVPVYLR